MEMTAAGGYVTIACHPPGCFDLFSWIMGGHTFGCFCEVLAASACMYNVTELRQATNLHGELIYSYFSVICSFRISMLRKLS